MDEEMLVSSTSIVDSTDSALVVVVIFERMERSELLQRIPVLLCTLEGKEKKAV